MIPREGYLTGVAGAAVSCHESSDELQSSTLTEEELESSAVEGDSPVSESVRVSSGRFPSKAGHVEARLNPGEPSPKAKYYLSTESEK